ncbi:MAG: HAD-IB family hydrolase [Betaproteobacteria bacterium]|jgi:HAD superfamily hydrolase (TIGR01490 family)|nr:HAD-IB family hydrolase [Betaproteobacteria bacterium]
MAETRYAFFDVDETLIGIKSMFSFRDFYLRWTLGVEQGAAAQKHAQTQVQEQVARGLERTEINRLFWESFRGFEQTDVQQAAYAWHQQVRQKPGYFIQQAVAALRQHQQEGTEPVFVSGSCIDILMPLATELGVKTLLTNRLEVEQGRFTGKLLPPQTIGAGKRQAMVDFLEESDALACDCYAYGDHLSDLPLLETVGHPRVVAGNTDLVSVARHRGWPVLGTSAHA